MSSRLLALYPMTYTLYIYICIYIYIRLYVYWYGPVLRLSSPHGLGGGTTSHRKEDLIWGQYMEACKDEDIGMNIQGYYQPQGGKISYGGMWIYIYIYIYTYVYLSIYIYIIHTIYIYMYIYIYLLCCILLYMKHILYVPKTTKYYIQKT